MVQHFIQGLILGASIAAIVGPITLLCIQRTLNFGLWSGVVSVLGAVTADGVYGAIGAFGLQTISGFLITYQYWFKLIGGLFLVYLGLNSLLKTKVHSNIRVPHTNLWHDYFSTFALTLSSPLTILFYISAFASIGSVGEPMTLIDSLQMLVGILSGAICYEMTLISIVAYIRHKLSNTILHRLSQLSAISLIALGIYALIV